MVKAMAIGALVATVKDVAKRSLPQISEQIEQVLDSAAHKFGADEQTLGGKDPERGKSGGIGHFSGNAMDELSDKAI